MILVLLCLLFVFLAGVFDAAQTIRKDYGDDNMILSWIKKKDNMWAVWYIGGNNVVWNPGIPSIPFLNIWYADFWHTMKFGWIYCFSIAIGLAGLAGLSFLGAATLVLIAQAIEGTTFQLFYGTLFRNDKKFDLMQFLKERNPFINYRE